MRYFTLPRGSLLALALALSLSPTPPAAAVEPRDVTQPGVDLQELALLTPRMGPALEPDGGNYLADLTRKDRQL